MPNAALNVNNICVKNECTCNFGISEEKCEFDSQEICQFCNTGFELTQNKTCAETICRCDNGLADVGCDNHQQSCVSCDSGYHKLEVCIGQKCRTRCVENQCTCLNGKSAVGESCISNDLEICENCTVCIAFLNPIIIKIKLLKFRKTFITIYAFYQKKKQLSF